MLLVVFLGVLIATIFLPASMLAVVAINTAVVLVISALQIGIILLPRTKPIRREISRQPRVAILVPSYNEPPGLLLQTIEALSKLSYHAYEVIVIDNNTKDVAIWQPVKTFCETLGPRFRFLHVDGLPGFKAGALNYALERVDPSIEYIAVIDSDYVVRRDFLSTAIPYFSSPDIALVQFPQEYRNTVAHNQPIADEYRHFFKIYMNMANHLDCVPSTGTVSVYVASALRSIAGFRSETLTEDADAGLRLYASGYRGVYVEQAVGQGLMPYDLAAYRKQKHRWAVGNAQSLKTLISLYGAIPFRSWLGFLSHLTAWDHLNFLPFAVLAGYVFVATPLVTTNGLHYALFNVAAFSIFAMLLSRLALFLAAFRGEKNAISRAVRAFIVHVGMTFLYSEAFFEMLFRRKTTFERTNKFAQQSSPGFFKSAYKELILGLWFLIGAVEAFVYGPQIVAFCAFFISATALLAIFYIQWRLFPTKWYSTRLLAEAERRYRPFLKNASCAV